MLNSKQIIKQELLSSIREVVPQDFEINVESPKDPSHGDYTSNIALIISKKLKKSPLELAQEIAQKLNSSSSVSKYFDKVEAVAPGFINFWISKDSLLDSLTYLSTVEKIGTSHAQKGKKVMVEYTDPNPFKEFHIGHLIPNIVGEAICNLLESQGAEVKRVCYQGDVGLHVAKALYGIQDLGFKIEELEQKSLEDIAKALGEAYAYGAKKYEEGESAKEEIHKLNKMVYERDQTIMEVYQKGRAWSLEYFETIYKRLGTKFDYFYFESEVGKTGSDLVLSHVGDVFEKSEGAVIFPGEKYALHNRVFINSLGLPTYEAKELGLAPTKYNDYPYDLSIIVTGNEINEYFKVLLKALSLINPELALKTQHIGHGMLKLKSGKMSSRTGNVITGEWLLDETKRLIHESFKDMDEKTAEQVAVGSVKYALLKNNILESDVVFDFHETINMHGNTAAYLQYTYVRTLSILRKVEASNQKLELSGKETLQEKEEIDILRLLVKFPEIVEQSAANLTPHLLANYLFDVGQLFNLFYQKHKILSPVIPNKSLSSRANEESVAISKEEIASAMPRNDNDKGTLRLELTRAVDNVLKEGLKLLGIEAPEKM